MHPGTHPSYQPVVFHNKPVDFTFLIRSTLTSSGTTEREDGNIYPVYGVKISNASHPLWTDRSRVLDIAGRVEKFRYRYGKHKRQALRWGTDGPSS